MVWPTITVALLVGVGIGWWLGSWATCGDACGFDVGLFEAIGTWVGGVALAATAFAFTVSQTWSASKKEKEQALGAAIMCVLRAKPVVDGNRLVRVEFNFQNKTTHAIHNVSGSLVGGPVFQQDRRVQPGRIWGFKAAPEALGLPVSVASEVAARRLVNAQVVPNLVFTFSVDGHEFIRYRGSTYPRALAPKDVLPASS